MIDNGEHWKFLWEMRGIETPCKRCDGTGRIVYGSTSTFMRGIGGAVMTPGICDRCWGSGDSNRPGPNLKSLYYELHRLRRDVRP